MTASRPMSEAEIQRAGVRVLRSLGYRVIRLPASGVRGRTGQGAGAGCPDHLVLGKNALAVFIEWKTVDGKLSEAQEAWISWARARDHRVLVCCSVQDAINTVKGTR